MLGAVGGVEIVKASGRAIYVACPGGRTQAGGMGRMVDYMMTAWEADRRHPPMVCIDTTGPLVKWREPYYFALALLHLLAAALRRRIGLLHIHMAERGSVLRKLIVLLLGRLAGCPTVVHMHAGPFPDFYEGLPKPAQWLITRMLRRADRFIVLGSEWRPYFIDRVGLDPARVVVIPNGVPASLPGEPLAREKPFRLFYAGVLIERKGVGDLLVALARLRGLEWTLDLAGSGDTARWRALAWTLGIGERVHFLGWLNSAEVHRRLDVCNALVLPSHVEALPMVVIEAMAHARAVIATRVGSIADAVGDGTSGLLVPPHDPDRLAEALERVIRNPEWCERLGGAGRLRYDATFTIDRLTARLADLFVELMSEKELQGRLSA